MDNLLIAGALMGLGGTIAMDIWAVLLNRVFRLPLPNWAFVGRWVSHVPGGTLFHEAIAQAPQVRAELRTGWVFHYIVGIVYGVIFALIMGAPWLAAPTFLPVWVFAILTISAGWFLLQPGMGLGWAASKTDSPWTVRILGLAAHTVFGLGMWGVALAL